MKEHQKMIVVNTNPKLVPALRERFSAHIDGFDKKRILKACKSCETLLPELVRSMLGKNETRKVKSTRKSKKKE